MKSFYGKNGAKTYLLQFKYGDYLLEGIEEVIKKEGIKHAVVVSGMGTHDRCRMHTVSTIGFPANDIVHEWLDEPIGISAMSGLIANGSPHIHMVMSVYGRSKEEGQVTYTGHLEPGSRVLYLVEMVLIEIEDLEMERVRDSNGIYELTKIDPEGNL